MKSDEDYLENLLKGVDKGNNFIDYFVTIGLSKSLMYDENLYECTIEELIEDRSKFKPEILTKFPPIDKSTINIDNNLIQHCFPNGFSPIESLACPNEISFSFVLDNAYYSTSFTQKYVSCLIFYEKFESYNKIFQKVKYSEAIERTLRNSLNNQESISKEYFRRTQANNEDRTIHLSMSIFHY